jgi:hypothetical protein
MMARIVKVSRNILPCQHRADVAGEACHRSRQRDFHRLDGVALQHLQHFLRIFSCIGDFQQIGSCRCIYPEIRIALAR